MARIGRLFIVPALVLLVGCSQWEKKKEPPAAQPRKAVSVQFRLASQEPKADWAQMAAGNGRSLYVSPTVELDQGDVELARAFHGEDGDFVELTFKHDGAERLRKLTSANIGSLLAIIVDGRLMCTPMIRTEVASGKAYISGQMTKEEADKLAQSLISP